MCGLVTVTRPRLSQLFTGERFGGYNQSDWVRNASEVQVVGGLGL